MYFLTVHAENGESLETSITGGVVLQEVLEEAPKWKVLSVSE